jgi:hypothetical protein
MRSTFFLFFIWSALPLLAQQTPHPHNWWGEIGYTRSSMVDEHSSPLRYRGDLLSLSSAYQRSGSLMFELGLQIQVGSSQAPAVGRREGTFYDPIDFAGQQDSYDFIVNPLLSRLDVQLYAKIYHPLSAQHELGLQWTTRYTLAAAGGDALQFAHTDLAPAYRFTTGAWDGRLQAEFALPLIGVVTRPNYGYDASLPDETNYFKGYLRTGTRVASLNQFFNPRIGFQYQWELSSGRTLGLVYRAQWLSCSFPRPYRQVEQGIHFQYQFAKRQ